MSKLEELEERIITIEKRNHRVELTKEWETSNTRRVGVAVLTYTVMVSFFYVIKVANPFINAAVPTLGFLLSTLSLDLIKQRWINSRK